MNTVPSSNTVLITVCMHRGSGVGKDVIAGMVANLKLSDCKVGAFTTLGRRFQVLVVLGKKEQL